MIARDAAPRQERHTEPPPAPAGALPARAQGRATGALPAAGAQPRADALGGVLARAVALRAGPLLQRYVYVEGSAKAPPVAQNAKAQARWCKTRQAWLDANAADFQIGLRTVKQYTKFKASWIGHMVYNNEPDPHKAKRPNESDAEYASRRQTKLPTDGDYREYDVQAYVAGARGTDRVIFDRRSKRAWYTGDHYVNLVEMKL